jgi:hypothetical protein
MFLFLLVALLLKVNLDDTGQNIFFTGIVAFLTIAPSVSPMLIATWTFLTSDEDEDEDDEEEPEEDEAPGGED